MVFSSGGNVGIGTVNPGYKLDVVETTSSAYARIFSNNSTNGRTATLELAAANGADPTTASILKFSALTSQQYSKLHIQNSIGTNLMTVLDNGNVGIGTSNPSAKLSISDGGAGGLEISPVGVNGGTDIISYNRSTATYKQITEKADNFVFNTSTAMNTLVMSNAGNVGIGTASPGVKLEIQ